MAATSAGSGLAIVATILPQPASGLSGEAVDIQALEGRKTAIFR